jgi:hypothetical protein
MERTDTSRSCISLAKDRRNTFGDNDKSSRKNMELSGNGAGDETRTRDIQLGRLALYQLSYSRVPTMVPAPPTSNVTAVG